jgi:hypothetical protein
LDTVNKHEVIMLLLVEAAAADIVLVV